MKKFLITVNGKQYEVDCEEIKDGSVPQQVTSAVQKPVETVAAAAPAQAPAAAPVASEPAKPVSSGTAGAVKIAAPMPGVIVKVDVSVGDSVKKGQTLLVFEAMKMENELKAPQDGTVASVNTSKGANIESGDVLVTLN